MLSFMSPTKRDSLDEGYDPNETLQESIRWKTTSRQKNSPPPKNGLKSILKTRDRHAFI
jgi:hypothetical protein